MDSGSDDRQRSLLVADLGRVKTPKEVGEPTLLSVGTQFRTHVVFARVALIGLGQ